MSKMRIFVSSTCYDLDTLRSELRPFISGHGYEPVMSEYSDVLFDPRNHTHSNCLKEIPGCDMVILIIGSRFGGQAIPDAVSLVDFSLIEKNSRNTDILQHKEKCSVTQLEVFKAIEHSIPVYAFIEDKVLHDHLVYEKNKSKKEIIDVIEFPSIQKKETALYIFEFINFLSHRFSNNSVIGFSSLEEIRTHLLQQWSQLFQRLLSESKTKSVEAQRIKDFSESLEDLKAVVLASLTASDHRTTAKGAVQYRQLISFAAGFVVPNIRELLLSNLSWEELLNRANIKEIRERRDDGGFSSSCYLICNDGTFYLCRMNPQFVRDLGTRWTGFRSLEDASREAIVDALLEDQSSRRIFMLRHLNKTLDEYLSERASESSDSSGATLKTLP